MMLIDDSGVQLAMIRGWWFHSCLNTGGILASMPYVAQILSKKVLYLQQPYSAVSWLRLFECHGLIGMENTQWNALESS